MKVYEDEVAVLFDPEASATIELVEITVAPVPSAAVATWNKLLKPTPVEALPLFVIVEVKVRAVFAVAVVGAVIEAVRFGIEFTVNVADADVAARYVESAAFVAVTVHVPGDVYERVELFVPETEHPAVPAEKILKVTVPLPDPPVVASVVKAVGAVTV